MSQQETGRDEQAPAAPHEQTRVLVADGLRWVVREVTAPAFDRRGGTHLVFDGELVMRRMRRFPPEWFSLSDEDLYALTQHIDR